MNEQELRGLIEDVRRRRLSRRAFTRTMIAAGLTAPMAAQMLASSGIATPAEQPAYRSTKRGGGGELKLLFWQGPMILNPHFATGITDTDASRIFYEPLAGYGPDGSLVPVLAAEIPSLENGGLSEDGLSVTWKLKKGVRWHDGVPFTAADCVFTSEYAADPANATTSANIYKDLKEVAVDDHTLRIEFASPRPFWYEAHCGWGGILPRHVFEPYKGSTRAAREAPANFAPVGIGPYVFVDFKPGDLIKGRLNPDYHMPNRPYFDTIEVKGGGDAVSAARAVMQTGEYDFAWNVQVEDEILKRLEAGGKGHVAINRSGWTEPIWLNNTDPWTEVDGERSSIRTRHPSLTDPAVRNHSTSWWIATRSSSISMAAPPLPSPTSSTAPRSLSRETRTTNSTSTKRSDCWTRQDGSLVPTEYERGTACGSSWFSVQLPTRRGKKLKRSSSRLVRRQASTWSFSLSSTQ